MASGSKRPPRPEGVYVSKGTVDDVFTPRRAPAARTPSSPRPKPAPANVVPSGAIEPLRSSVRPTPSEPSARRRDTLESPRRFDPRSDGGFDSSEQIATSDVRAPRRPPTIPPPVTRVDPRIERAARLCDELTRCGPGDEAPFVARFRALAEVGLAGLERSFPGLLWFDRQLPHQKPPRGRSVSPVASILIQLGLDAVPTVARLLHNDYADIRYYAALVAIDMASPALVPVLAELAFDEDAAIRELALEGMLAMRDSDACHLVCRSLERRVMDPKWPAQRRTTAIRMLTALRWPGVIPSLIAILELLEPGTPELARGALRTITTQDFGLDLKAWRKWHAKHGTEPRKTWLLEGLIGADVTLRDFAALELARLTGKDFGHRAGADVKECKRIQKLYAQA